MTDSSDGEFRIVKAFHDENAEAASTQQSQQSGASDKAQFENTVVTLLNDDDNEQNFSPSLNPLQSSSQSSIHDVETQILSKGFKPKNYDDKTSMQIMESKAWTQYQLDHGDDRDFYPNTAYDKFKSTFDAETQPLSSPPPPSLVERVRVKPKPTFSDRAKGFLKGFGSWSWKGGVLGGVLGGVGGAVGGAVVGQILIPIPFVGAGIGAIVGSAIGATVVGGGGGALLAGTVGGIKGAVQAARDARTHVENRLGKTSVANQKHVKELLDKAPGFESGKDWQAAWKKTAEARFLAQRGDDMGVNLENFKEFTGLTGMRAGEIHGQLKEFVEIGLTDGIDKMNEQIDKLGGLPKENEKKIKKAIKRAGKILVNNVKQRADKAFAERQRFLAETMDYGLKLMDANQEDYGLPKQVLFDAFMEALNETYGNDATNISRPDYGTLDPLKEADQLKDEVVKNLRSSLTQTAAKFDPNMPAVVRDAYLSSDDGLDAPVSRQGPFNADATQQVALTIQGQLLSDNQARQSGTAQVTNKFMIDFERNKAKPDNSITLVDPQWGGETVGLSGGDANPLAQPGDQLQEFTGDATRAKNLSALLNQNVLAPMAEGASMTFKNAAGAPLIMALDQEKLSTNIVATKDGDGGVIIDYRVRAPIQSFDHLKSPLPVDAEESAVEITMQLRLSRDDLDSDNPGNIDIASKMTQPPRYDLTYKPDWGTLNRKYADGIDAAGQTRFVEVQRQLTTDLAALANAKDPQANKFADRVARDLLVMSDVLHQRGLRGAQLTNEMAVIVGGMIGELDPDDPEDLVTLTVFDEALRKLEQDLNGRLNSNRHAVLQANDAARGRYETTRDEFLRLFRARLDRSLDATRKNELLDQAADESWMPARLAEAIQNRNDDELGPIVVGGDMTDARAGIRGPDNHRERVLRYANLAIRSAVTKGDDDKGFPKQFMEDLSRNTSVTLMTDNENDDGLVLRPDSEIDARDQLTEFAGSEEAAQNLAHLLCQSPGNGLAPGISTTLKQNDGELFNFIKTSDRFTVRKGNNDNFIIDIHIEQSGRGHIGVQDGEGMAASLRTGAGTRISGDWQLTVTREELENTDFGDENALKSLLQTATTGGPRWRMEYHPSWRGLAEGPVDDMI